MPIGIVSQSEFEKELSNSDDFQIKKGIIIETPKPGRKNGDFNVPPVLRKIIGETSIEEGNSGAKEIAREFGVSDSSISAYKNGAHSTASYHNPDPGLRQTIDDTKSKITTRAKSRLLRAIHHITDDKLKDAKVRDLAGIAKDLSTVVKSLEPSSPNTPLGNSPTFVFYTPPQKKEESYDVILLKE